MGLSCDLTGSSGLSDIRPRVMPPFKMTEFDVGISHVQHFH